MCLSHVTSQYRVLRTNQQRGALGSFHSRRRGSELAPILKQHRFAGDIMHDMELISVVPLLRLTVVQAVAFKKESLALRAQAKQADVAMDAMPAHLQVQLHVAELNDVMSSFNAQQHTAVLVAQLLVRQKTRAHVVSWTLNHHRITVANNAAAAHATGDDGDFSALKLMFDLISTYIQGCQRGPF